MGIVGPNGGVHIATAFIRPKIAVAFKLFSISEIQALTSYLTASGINSAMSIKQSDVIPDLFCTIERNSYGKSCEKLHNKSSMQGRNVKVLPAIGAKFVCCENVVTRDFHSFSRN